MEYKDAMDAYLIIEEVLDLEKAVTDLSEVESPEYVEILGQGGTKFISKQEELAIYLHKQTKLFLESKITEQKEILTKINSNGSNSESKLDTGRSV